MRASARASASAAESVSGEPEAESASRKASSVGKGLARGMWCGCVMIGFGLENLSLIFGGLKFGGSSSSPSESKAKGSRVPLGLGPSGLALGGGASSSATVVRDAVRADLRVPRVGSGVDLEGGLAATEANFEGVDFLEGEDFAGGFLGGEDFAVDLVGVAGRSLPFVVGCLLIILAARAREETGRAVAVGVDDTSFLSCSDCLLENLVGRVESPPLLLADGGSNSRGIGFVLPDFLRPELSRNEVGVWVVALFHGGELSIFRFLLGGFLTSRDSPSPSSRCPCPCPSSCSSRPG